MPGTGPRKSTWRQQRRLNAKTFLSSRSVVILPKTPTNPPRTPDAHRGCSKVFGRDVSVVYDTRPRLGCVILRERAAAEKAQKLPDRDLSIDQHALLTLSELKSAVIQAYRRS
jgi:hypothetical protein